MPEEHDAPILTADQDGLRPPVGSPALESAMQEANAARLRLQEAVEASSDGFALWDAEDRLVLCNARFHDFWRGLGDLVQPGVSYETLLRAVAKLGLVISADEDRESWVAECLAGHKDPKGPYTHHFSDGRVVQAINTPTADGGLVSVFTDVSALLEVEEARHLRAIAEGATLLASTVTNIAQGVAVFDAEHRLVIWNRRACELLNLPYYAIVKEMGFRQLALLMAQHRAQLDFRVGANIMAWVNRERARAPTQIDVHYPGSTVIEAAFRSMPDQGFVVTFTDKTAEREAKRTLEHHGEELAAEVRARTRELVQVNLQMQREVRQRREAAEALESARAAAVDANQSKTRFLAAASHDLLQPLSAAHLYLSALEDVSGELSATAQSHLAGLAGSLHSVEDLLSALLEISKLDGGAIQPDVKDVPLGPILDALHQSFEGLAAEKDLRFKTLKTDAWARTDPLLLRRILQNLVTNAVKYTHDGGVIVGVRPDPSGWRIEVWDSGPGISVHDQEAIFEEFKRGSGWEVGDVAGAGLGLAIVRRTADLLGHPIRLRSDRGRGTLFQITVPRVQRALDAVRRTSAAPLPQSNWQNRLVLLLENDVEISHGMHALFQRWDCPLLSAASFEELRDRLEDEHAVPDFLVADLDLDSETDGLSAVEELRKTHPGLSAALVTADRSPQTLARAKEMGVECFLKPIKPAELRAYIEYSWQYS